LEDNFIFFKKIMKGALKNGSNIPFDEKNAFKSVSHLNTMDNKLLRVCDVCMDNLHYFNDYLMTCKRCFHSVHESCYGNRKSKRIKKFTCERCLYSLKYKKNPTEILCHFCSDKFGILRYIEEKKIWVHIDCVSYIQEIYFLDDSKKTIFLDDLKTERFKKTCFLCHIRKGAVVQCDERDCIKYFHVRCGKKEGVIKHWRVMEKRRIAE
jgi:hypothetical protein